MLAAASSPADPKTETVERLLDAAELLFAAQGFEGASIRAIAREAGVNLAATHYHFGSKEALYKQVFLRRLQPVNAERVALLEQAEAIASAQHEPLTVPAIARALLSPPLLLGRRHPNFLPLLSRNFSNPPPFMAEVMAREVVPVARRFIQALRRALPHVEAQEIFWRMHFTIGAVLFTAAHHHRVAEISAGLCPEPPIELTLDRLLTFACAGLSAPAR